MMLLGIGILVHLALFLLLVGNPVLSAAVVAACVGYHALVTWAVMGPRSRLFGPNLSRLNTEEKVVALTFDDGPHADVTPRVLDILRARNVAATFFVIGKWVERHPEIVRRIVADGHSLGNHTHRHSYAFWALSPRRMLREVQDAQSAIATTSGSACRWFRPPVGLKNAFLPRVLARCDLRLVSWDTRFLDRRGLDRERLSRRLRRRVAPGSILLLHDGHDRKPEGNPAVLATLPIVLDVLDEMGYRCVPIG